MKFCKLLPPEDREQVCGIKKIDMTCVPENSIKLRRFCVLASSQIKLHNQQMWYPDHPQGSIEHPGIDVRTRPAQNMGSYASLCLESSEGHCQGLKADYKIAVVNDRPAGTTEGGLAAREAVQLGGRD